MSSRVGVGSNRVGVVSGRVGVGADGVDVGAGSGGGKDSKRTTTREAK